MRYEFCAYVLDQRFHVLHNSFVSILFIFHRRLVKSHHYINTLHQNLSLHLSYIVSRHRFSDSSSSHLLPIG